MIYLISWLVFFPKISLIKNTQYLHHIYWSFISFWVCITKNLHCGVCDASTSTKPRKFGLRTSQEEQCWWEMAAVKCWCMKLKLQTLASALCLANCDVLTQGSCRQKVKLLISIKVIGIGMLQIKGCHQAAFLAQPTCR